MIRFGNYGARFRIMPPNEASFDVADAPEHGTVDRPRNGLERLVFDPTRLRLRDLIGDFHHLVGIGTVVARGARGRGCRPQRHGAVAVDPAGQIPQSNRGDSGIWAGGTSQMIFDAADQTLLQHISETAGAVATEGPPLQPS